MGYLAESRDPLTLDVNIPTSDRVIRGGRTRAMPVGNDTDRNDADAHFSTLLDAIGASMRERNFAQALRYADRAGRLAPTDPVITALRGRLSATSGETAAAASLLADAAERRPDPDTISWLIEALLAAGRPEDAAHHLSAALQRFAVTLDGSLAVAARRVSRWRGAAGSA
jgi:hypothetical protein